MWLFVYWVADKVPEERKKLDDQGSEGKRANQKKNKRREVGNSENRKSKRGRMGMGHSKGEIDQVKIDKRNEMNAFVRRCRLMPSCFSHD